MARKKVKRAPRREIAVCHEYYPLAFTADAVWSGVDNIALSLDVSPSRLAIMSGLDASALNKSKRTEGHWLSMESLALILAASGVSLKRFSAIIGATNARA